MLFPSVVNAKECFCAKEMISSTVSVLSVMRALDTLNAKFWGVSFAIISPFLRTRTLITDLGHFIHVMGGDKERNSIFSLLF